MNAENPSEDVRLLEEPMDPNEEYFRAVVRDEAGRFFAAYDLARVQTNGSLLGGCLVDAAVLHGYHLCRFLLSRLYAEEKVSGVPDIVVERGLFPKEFEVAAKRFCAAAWTHLMSMQTTRQGSYDFTTVLDKVYPHLAKAWGIVELSWDREEGR